MNRLLDEPLNIPQTDPPRPARLTLPTMYDLPSEDPEEPGLPDDFHYFQPQLLRETFAPPTWPADLVYVATDLNLYYDVRHPLRHKRPDWFAVLGVSKLYEGRDLRLSYVVWQEGVSPFIVVELLSPGTEQEDLGRAAREVDQPPGKWEVYEKILRVPYYVVFSRYTHQLQVFGLAGGGYQALPLKEGRIWLPELGLGLGLWSGVYQGLERQWLRWYDAEQGWILTPVEREQREVEQERRRTQQERQRAEQESQRAEQERQRAERLAAQLRKLGVEPEE
jgi:Uma2 family endonuclease